MLHIQREGGGCGRPWQERQGHAHREQTGLLVYLCYSRRQGGEMVAFCRWPELSFKKVQQHPGLPYSQSFFGGGAVFGGGAG